ncbi:MAG: PAS domain S-box protein [Deltaproteobacteria bacterium]|nr:PAS domain S-box protein [Deltaproteobacteria bacterium]
MSHETPKNNHVRHKLVLVETLILAIPLLVLSYILYQSGYQFEYHHLILLSMLITLILIGLIIVRQIFDKISMVAVSLKQVESGGTHTMDIRHDISEFHEISNTFNNLVKKLEETTEGLRQSQFELLTIKDISETAKEVRNLDHLFEILLEKSMSVTGAQTGSVLTIAGGTFSNKDLVLLPKQRESASNHKLFQKFRVAAAKGHHETLEKDSFIDIADFVARNVLIDGQPLLIQDIEKDTRTLKTNDPQYGPPSFLSMPIFAQNKLVAVMNLSNKARGQLFECHDEKIISIILGEISFALENATMHSNLENQLRIIKGHNLELEKEIEARNRMEKARQESEKKYKELLDFLPISVFEIDFQGNFTTVNHTSLETFGYTQDDIVQGLNALKMFIPEDLDRVKEDIQKVLNGGKMDSAPYTMIRKDGSTFPVLISANPVTSMNTVIGFRGAVIDFTERRKMEESLQESEERYHSLFDHSMDAILLAKLDGSILDANPAACDMFRSTRNEIQKIGRDGLTDLTDPRLQTALSERADKGAAMGEITMCRANGDKFPAEITSTIFVDASGRQTTSMIIRDVTKRKQAQEELKERDNRFKKLSSHVPGMIYQFMRKPDGTYCVPFTTEAIENIFGCSPKDVCEGFSPITRVVFSEDLDRLIGSIEASAEHMTTWQCEYRVQIPGRSIRWMLGHSTPEKLADGTIIWHGFNTDITDHKRAEDALRESEEKYRLVVENSDEAILIAQAGMLKYVNPMTMKILGYSETELLSTPFIEIIHPDDREKLMAAHLKRMNGEPTQPVRQFKVCCKDGSVKWADSHAIVISWNGKPATLNFIMDVTERKRAEELLLESEKKYRFLTEKMTDIVWIQDMNLRTTYVSPSIEAVLGFTPEERLAQDVREQLTPASMSVALDIMAKELALEQQGQADPERKLVLELEYCHKDGSTRWIENIISGIRDDRGVLAGLHGVSRDITERKHAEEELSKAKEQLLQSEKLASIGRLSAGVAHEILNPVNIISMELQLLQTMENLPPDVPKELKICMAQINRIIKIAENLKQMSRIPEKKVVMADINDTIDHILGLYATQLKIEGIETEIQYQSDLPVIAMDKEKIEQVILNLISNATAAMEGKEKKVLRIITEREKLPGDRDQLKITIADTGIGIKSEHMSKIFDPFFTTKEQGKGTGLGLYISYGIVYDHQGMIWAVNNEWGGASFYVRLPLETNIEKNYR